MLRLRIYKVKYIYIRIQVCRTSWLSSNLPTILENFLNDKNDPVRWLKDLIDDYEKSEITLENIISKRPVVGYWLHDALPQLQTFAHQQCLPY